MIKKEVHIFTDDDIELLSKHIPFDPCKDCKYPYVPYTCWACTSVESYSKEMKAYKDSGIKEYAQKIAKIRKYNDEIKEAKREMNALIDTLPDEIVRNKNIKFKEWEINHD